MFPELRLRDSNLFNDVHRTKGRRCSTLICKGYCTGRFVSLCLVFLLLATALATIVILFLARRRRRVLSRILVRIREPVGDSTVPFKFRKHLIAHGTLVLRNSGCGCESSG